MISPTMRHVAVARASDAGTSLFAAQPQATLLHGALLVVASWQLWVLSRRDIRALFYRPAPHPAAA